MAIVNRNLSAVILPLPPSDQHNLLNKFPSKELGQVTPRPRHISHNMSPSLHANIYRRTNNTNESTKNSTNANNNKRYSYMPTSHHYYHRYYSQSSSSEFELSGLIQMKLIKKTHSQKPFNKPSWNYCLVTFERGQFKMFKATSEDSLYSVDQENLDKQLGTLCLLHSVARKCFQRQSASSGSQMKFVWELELANGAKYQFLVNNEESANKWIDSINYWAARESVPPETLPKPQSPESSQTSTSLKRKSVHLLDKLLGRAQHWSPPLPPLNRSQLCIIDQVNKIQGHLALIHDTLAKLKTEESETLLSMGYGHYLIGESDKYQIYLRRLAAICDNSSNNRHSNTKELWRYSTDSSQSLNLSITSTSSSSSSNRNSWAPNNSSRTSIIRTP